MITCTVHFIGGFTRLQALQKSSQISSADDIPALYSELSRDDSNIVLPPEFSTQDSEDSAASQSQSMLESLKSRKNQRYEMPEAGRALRRGRSSMSKPVDVKKQKLDNSQSDIFEESSDEFKKPGEGVNDEIEKVLDSSANNSQSSVDEIIESSQDVTMEADQRPRRRSRRIALDQVDSKAENPERTVSSELNKWGETPLFIAVKKGEFSKAEELVAQSADPNIANFTGNFPIHEAAVSSKPDAAKLISLLCSHGAKVDSLSSEGDTALHKAIRQGTPEQVRALLRAEADVGKFSLLDELLTDVSDVLTCRSGDQGGTECVQPGPAGLRQGRPGGAEGGEEGVL